MQLRPLKNPTWSVWDGITLSHDSDLSPSQMQQPCDSFIKVCSLSHGFTFRVTQNDLNSSILPPDTWPTCRQSRLREQQVRGLLKAPEEGISVLFWNRTESGLYHPALVFLKMGLRGTTASISTAGNKRNFPRSPPVCKQRFTPRVTSHCHSPWLPQHCKHYQHLNCWNNLPLRSEKVTGMCRGKQTEK